MIFFGVKHGRKRSIFRVFAKKLIPKIPGWDPLVAPWMVKKSLFGTFSKKKCLIKHLKRPKIREIFKEKIYFKYFWWIFSSLLTLIPTQIFDFLIFFAFLGAFFATFWPRGRGLARCGNIATAWAHPCNHGNKSSCVGLKQKLECDIPLSTVMDQLPLDLLL